MEVVLWFKYHHSYITNDSIRIIRTLLQRESNSYHKNKNKMTYPHTNVCIEGYKFLSYTLPHLYCNLNLNLRFLPLTQARTHARFHLRSVFTLSFFDQSSSMATPQNSSSDSCSVHTASPLQISKGFTPSYIMRCLYQLS